MSSAKSEDNTPSKAKRDIRSMFNVAKKTSLSANEASEAKPSSPVTLLQAETTIKPAALPSSSTSLPRVEEHDDLHPVTEHVTHTSENVDTTSRAVHPPATADAPRMNAATSADASPSPNVPLLNEGDVEDLSDDEVDASMDSIDIESDTELPVGDKADPSNVSHISLDGDNDPPVPSTTIGTSSSTTITPPEGGSSVFAKLMLRAKEKQREQEEQERLREAAIREKERLAREKEEKRLRKEQEREAKEAEKEEKRLAREKEKLEKQRLKDLEKEEKQRQKEALKEEKKREKLEQEAKEKEMKEKEAQEREAREQEVKEQEAAAKRLAEEKRKIEEEEKRLKTQQKESLPSTCVIVGDNPVDNIDKASAASAWAILAQKRAAKAKSDATAAPLDSTTSIPSPYPTAMSTPSDSVTAVATEAVLVAVEPARRSPGAARRRAQTMQLGGAQALQLGEERRFAPAAEGRLSSARAADVDATAATAYANCVASKERAKARDGEVNGEVMNDASLVDMAHDDAPITIDTASWQPLSGKTIPGKSAFDLISGSRNISFNETVAVAEHTDYAYEEFLRLEGAEDIWTMPQSRVHLYAQVPDTTATVVDSISDSNTLSSVDAASLHTDRAQRYNRRKWRAACTAQPEAPVPEIHCITAQESGIYASDALLPPAYVSKGLTRAAERVAQRSVSSTHRWIDLVQPDDANLAVKSTVVSTDSTAQLTAISSSTSDTFGRVDSVLLNPIFLSGLLQATATLRNSPQFTNAHTLPENTETIFREVVPLLMSCLSNIELEDLKAPLSGCAVSPNGELLHTSTPTAHSPAFHRDTTSNCLKYLHKSLPNLAKTTAFLTSYLRAYALRRKDAKAKTTAGSGKSTVMALFGGKSASVAKSPPQSLITNGAGSKMSSAVSPARPPAKKRGRKSKHAHSDSESDDLDDEEDASSISVYLSPATRSASDAAVSHPKNDVATEVFRIILQKMLAQRGMGSSGLAAVDAAAILATDDQAPVELLQMLDMITHDAAVTPSVARAITAALAIVEGGPLSDNNGDQNGDRASNTASNTHAARLRSHLRLVRAQVQSMLHRSLPMLVPAVIPAAGIILSGTSTVEKATLVEAACAAGGYGVLEINMAQKPTIKHVLAVCQEASVSHRVTRTTTATAFASAATPTATPSVWNANNHYQSPFEAPATPGQASGMKKPSGVLSMFAKAQSKTAVTPVALDAVEITGKPTAGKSSAKKSQLRRTSAKRTSVDSSSDDSDIDIISSSEDDIIVDDSDSDAKISRPATRKSRSSNDNKTPSRSTNIAAAAASLRTSPRSRRVVAEAEPVDILDTPVSTRRRRRTDATEELSTPASTTAAGASVAVEAESPIVMSLTQDADVDVTHLSEDSEDSTRPRKVPKISRLFPPLSSRTPEGSRVSEGTPSSTHAAADVSNSIATSAVNIVDVNAVTPSSRNTGGSIDLTWDSPSMASGFASPIPAGKSDTLHGTVILFDDIDAMLRECALGKTIEGLLNTAKIPYFFTCRALPDAFRNLASNATHFLGYPNPDEPVPSEISISVGEDICDLAVLLQQATEELHAGISNSTTSEDTRKAYLDLARELYTSTSELVRVPPLKPSHIPDQPLAALQLPRVHVCKIAEEDPLHVTLALAVAALAYNWVSPVLLAKLRRCLVAGDAAGTLRIIDGLIRVISAHTMVNKGDYRSAMLHCAASLAQYDAEIAHPDSTLNTMSDAVIDVTKAVVDTKDTKLSRSDATISALPLQLPQAPVLTAASRIDYDDSDSNSSLRAVLPSIFHSLMTQPMQPLPAVATATRFARLLHGYKEKGLSRALKSLLTRNNSSYAASLALQSLCSAPTALATLSSTPSFVNVTNTVSAATNTSAFTVPTAALQPTLLGVPIEDEVAKLPLEERKLWKELHAHKFYVAEGLSTLRNVNYTRCAPVSAHHPFPLHHAAYSHELLPVDLTVQSPVSLRLALTTCPLPVAGDAASLLQHQVYRAPLVLPVVTTPTTTFTTASSAVDWARTPAHSLTACSTYPWQRPSHTVYPLSLLPPTHAYTSKKLSKLVASAVEAAALFAGAPGQAAPPLAHIFAYLHPTSALESLVEDIYTPSSSLALNTLTDSATTLTNTIANPLATSSLAHTLLSQLYAFAPTQSLTQPLVYSSLASVTVDTPPPAPSMSLSLEAATAVGLSSTQAQKLWSLMFACDEDVPVRVSDAAESATQLCTSTGVDAATLLHDNLGTATVAISTNAAREDCSQDHTIDEEMDMFWGGPTPMYRAIFPSLASRLRTSVQSSSSIAYDAVAPAHTATITAPTMSTDGSVASASASASADDMATCVAYLRYYTHAPRGNDASGSTADATKHQDNDDQDVSGSTTKSAFFALEGTRQAYDDADAQPTSSTGDEAAALETTTEVPDTSEIVAERAMTDESLYSPDTDAIASEDTPMQDNDDDSATAYATMTLCNPSLRPLPVFQLQLSQPRRLRAVLGHRYVLRSQADTQFSRLVKLCRFKDVAEMDRLVLWTLSFLQTCPLTLAQYVRHTANAARAQGSQTFFAALTDASTPAAAAAVALCRPCDVSGRATASNTQDASAAVNPADAVPAQVSAAIKQLLAGLQSEQITAGASRIAQCVDIMTSLLSPAVTVRENMPYMPTTEMRAFVERLASNAWTPHPSTSTVTSDPLTSASESSAPAIAPPAQDAANASESDQAKLSHPLGWLSPAHLLRSLAAFLPCGLFHSLLPCAELRDLVALASDANVKVADAAESVVAAESVDAGEGADAVQSAGGEGAKGLVSLPLPPLLTSLDMLQYIEFLSVLFAKSMPLLCPRCVDMCVCAQQAQSYIEKQYLCVWEPLHSSSEAASTVKSGSSLSSTTVDATVDVPIDDPALWAWGTHELTDLAVCTSISPSLHSLLYRQDVSWESTPSVTDAPAVEYYNTAVDAVSEHIASLRNRLHTHLPTCRNTACTGCAGAMRRIRTKMMYDDESDEEAAQKQSDDNDASTQVSVVPVPVCVLGSVGINARGCGVKVPTITVPAKDDGLSIKTEDVSKSESIELASSSGLDVSTTGSKSESASNPWSWAQPSPSRNTASILAANNTAVTTLQSLWHVCDAVSVSDTMLTAATFVNPDSFYGSSRRCAKTAFGGDVFGATTSTDFRNVGVLSRLPSDKLSDGVADDRVSSLIARSFQSYSEHLARQDELMLKEQKRSQRQQKREEKENITKRKDPEPKRRRRTLGDEDEEEIQESVLSVTATPSTDATATSTPSLCLFSSSATAITASDASDASDASSSLVSTSLPMPLPSAAEAVPYSSGLGWPQLCTSPLTPNALVRQDALPLLETAVLRNSLPMVAEYWDTSSAVCGGGHEYRGDGYGGMGADVYDNAAVNFDNEHEYIKRLYQHNRGLASSKQRFGDADAEQATNVNDAKAEAPDVTSTLAFIDRESHALASVRALSREMCTALMLETWSSHKSYIAACGHNNALPRGLRGCKPNAKALSKWMQEMNAAVSASRLPMRVLPSVASLIALVLNSNRVRVSSWQHSDVFRYYLPALSHISRAELQSRNAHLDAAAIAVAAETGRRRSTARRQAQYTHRLQPCGDAGLAPYQLLALYRPFG